jgi:ribosomal protein S18 acetylase RimI-like enzyme
MRYRLPEGYPRSMTDVIGELITLDPPTVRSADGEIVSVSPARVVAMKALGPRPIRATDIRALEAAGANGWPGVEYQPLDGWLLRAGHGYTRRANSAVPLDKSATTGAATLAQIQYWYRQRGLAPMLVLIDRVVPVPPGWSTFNEVLVMAADLDTLVLPEGPSIVAVDPAPSRGWSAMYVRHDARAASFRDAVHPVLTAVREGVVGFAALGAAGAHSNPNADGADVHALPLAIARAAITDAPDGRRWVGLSSVHVAAEHRRHGLGTLICAESLRWGLAHRATHAYLQVMPDNTSAIGMYRAMGFVDHHYYRYAVIPTA